MEKINVAELLKDCPKGMELNCLMYDGCTFEGIEESENSLIKVRTPDGPALFTQYGEVTYWESAKCVIFPKGKTTWEGFVPPYKFKDGDVVFSGLNLISIFKGIKNGVSGSLHSYVSACVSTNSLLDSTIIEINRDCWTLENIRLATEEEKEKLFQAIKDNGYKWNAETKALEKLIKPKFKVGDRIVEKNGITKPFTITQVGGGYYCSNDKNAVGIMRIEDQDKYELVPNKFDVSTLIPFESRVLVRDSDIGIWLPEFFGCLCDDNDCPYMIVGGTKWKCCIPYEGNEHLLAKCDDCIDFYKNWE